VFATGILESSHPGPSWTNDRQLESIPGNDI
jgi:hypothetical protein